MANISTRISALPNPSYEETVAFPSLELPGLPTVRGGLARGTLTEIVGSRSSGRMAVLLHTLAQATARGEVCAVVDANDEFHPASAASAGVVLSRIVWIRCGGNVEHAMRAADLLIHAGGFGVIVLDLCEVSGRALDRIPISYWHRFRRAVEHTPTVLLICSPAALAKASSQRLEMELEQPLWSGLMPFRLLRGISLQVFSRKPLEGPRHKVHIPV